MAGRSASAAEAWRNGTRTPARDARKLIAERWPEVTEAGWDELPLAEPAKAPAPAPDALGTRESTRAFARDVEARGRALLSALDDPDMTPRAQAELFAKVTDGLMKCGRLTGATALNEREILGSPAWLRVERAIVDALAPWPDAQRAAGEALAELGGAS